MSTVEFKNICKRYTPQSLTIFNANIRIEDGEFCVFVGPSGCGKSTLLRLVAGLEEITSGELLIDGRRANDLPPAQRGLAMVFQSYALYPHMTVRENMAFGLQVLGADKAAIARKVQEASDALQLNHLLDRLPKALSGGQRQRVAIGRAIVKEPGVFLFDEPLSNLDAALRVQTRLEIAKLHQRLSGSSMIYVTHDQVEAMTLADKIVLLNTGDRIAQHGSVAQIGAPLTLYHRPNSLFVAEFIGSPKMNVLPAILQAGSSARAEIRIGPFTLVAAVNASRLPDGAAVKLGLRPEDIRVVAASSEQAALHGTVSYIERLGESSLLYVDVGAGLPVLSVKTEGTSSMALGAAVALAVDPECLHLFNAAGLACERTVDLPCG
jgi:multiple sugar transport system ATP-binding protein